MLCGIYHLPLTKTISGHMHPMIQRQQCHLPIPNWKSLQPMHKEAQTPYMFSTNFTNIEINPLSEVIDNDPVSHVYKKAKDFKSQAS